MRLPAVPFGPARAVRAGLFAAALMSTASCAILGGGPPKPRMESLEMTSTPDANSCGRESGNSLYFRVLQVTDASPLEGLPLDQVWDKEEKVLGPALVAEKYEDVIDAGSKRVFQIKHDARAKSIVVVGNFCKTSGACWRIVHPVSAGLKLGLTADASCLSEAKR